MSEQKWGDWSHRQRRDDRCLTDYQMISIPHFRSVIAGVTSLTWLPRNELLAHKTGRKRTAGF